MLKINFLGDSITMGAIASKPENCFVSLVAKMLNAETRNYGISGSRIAPQHHSKSTEPKDFSYCERVHLMNKDADYVFVLGGTNDFGHGDAPFGKIGDKSPETYCGSIDYLINELLKDYNKDQIVFVPPLYRANENNPYGDGDQTLIRKPLPMYRQAQINIVNAYGIKLLDIKDEIGPGENNPLLPDGLHPSDDGHYLIAKLISNYIKYL